MSFKDTFYWKTTKDLEILGKASGRRTIIRATLPNPPKRGVHGQEYAFRYGIGFTDALGWPQDIGGEGLVLTADELIQLADILNRLIGAGEIRDSCDEGEHSARVAQRAKFEREHQERSGRTPTH